MSYDRAAVVKAARSVPVERLRRWAAAEEFAADMDLDRFAEMKAADAIHEAGHAVAAWHLGSAVHFVQLRHGAGGLGGQVRHDPRFDLQVAELVTYAGAAAEHPTFDLPSVLERHNLIGDGPETWWEYTEGEESQALHDIVSHSQNDREIFSGGAFPGFDVTAFCMVQGLVRAEWRDVERVAISLLERVTMKGDDLAKLLEGAA